MPAPRPPYIPQPGLLRHPGTILALALTTDGGTLVTGGSDGTRLWNPKTFRTITRPAPAGVRGATTVVVCIRRVDEPVDVIFSSTSNGFFFCWRRRNGVWEETFARQIDEPTDITGIAFDTSTNRLILCSSGGKVQAWGCLRDDSGRAHLSRVFSRNIANFAPRAIAFAAFDSSKDKDILVFGQNDIGPIYKLRGKSGETLEEWSVGGPIGDARVDWNLGLFLLDDIFAGPSLWRNVRFGEGSTVIVCGCDHGRVYIFDLHTGERMERLDIGTPEWVQVVATAEIDGVATVFAAPARSEDGDVELFVWKRLEPELDVAPNDWRASWMNLFNILIIFCCVGFVYQNAGYGAYALRKMGVIRSGTGGEASDRVVGASSVGAGISQPGKASAVTAKADAFEGIVQFALEDL
ncbi:WD40-repeat-containing domain protein [Mycena leptocephala]|nr:WD40-repeat-containing domain protein [Mycena leptocephala]